MRRVAFKQRNYPVGNSNLLTPGSRPTEKNRVWEKCGSAVGAQRKQLSGRESQDFKENKSFFPHRKLHPIKIFWHSLVNIVRTKEAKAEDM
jgi:hypothetical protein